MALFTAYFDASGKRNDQGKAKAMYVAGFVAPVSGWQGLEESWPALLAKYEIPAPLHMADFMSHKKRYSAWMGEDEEDGAAIEARRAKRDAFRREAVRLLSVHTNKPFGVGVMLPALRRMFDDYDMPEWEPREPFVWCGIRALKRLDDWWESRKKSKRFRASDRLEILFEDGDEGMGELKRAAWEALGLTVGSRPNYDKSFIPFAACDFLAWEFRHWAGNRATGYFFRDNVAPATDTPAKRAEALKEAASRIKPTPVLLDVVQYLPAGALHFTDADALAKYCAFHEFPRRVNP